MSEIGKPSCFESFANFSVKNFVEKDIKFPSVYA